MHNPGEMNSERHYFALIGDIIDSRHEQDRYDVQKKLQSILSSVNAEHAAHIAADFLITLGDEFQGLLFAEKGADPIFVADRIIDEMFPVRIRIAIGFGGIATQIRREAAIGADGEAFYRARHGMNLLRKAENRGRACSRILLDAGGTECSDCDRNARRKESAIRRLFSKQFWLRLSRRFRAACVYGRPKASAFVHWAFCLRFFCRVCASRMKTTG